MTAPRASRRKKTCIGAVVALLALAGLSLSDACVVEFFKNFH